MGDWVWPAYVGILGGAIAFVLFMVPIVAIQYRMYGRFTWLRFFGAAGLSVYGVALVAYTLLPLPDPADLQCPPGGSVFQGVPFNFISDIQRETAGLGITGTLTSRATLQVAFNVILFIPWGVIARRYLSWSIPVAVLSGAAASVLIELTQFTGLWGLYDCAYRVGDVDDLITNTLGALIGALFAPLLLWFMPQRKELLATRGRSRPVTVWRRWLGMVIDYAALSFLGAVFVILYRIGLMALGMELPDDEDPVSQVLIYLIPGFLVFYLPAFYPSGASLGQRAVWLKPEWPAAGASRRFLRASVTGGLYTVLGFLAAVVPVTVLDPLPALVLFAAFIAVPLTKKRGLSGVLSGAEMVDARAAGDDQVRSSSTIRAT
ncbi:VanZ family protein [Pseudarthrobacter sp. J64]|uniref:VanZ family protein n=1 Tax=Pseudarthrobacter sp. J64 TaxID=3116485 RepID=UPI002E80F89F|nr:VanZ family protein [Pseudarthrobacter sp. J64]MEE2570321.1 VanZ family protein [Pseudarthrobacter sp. J64]